MTLPPSGALREGTDRVCGCDSGGFLILPITLVGSLSFSKNDLLSLAAFCSSVSPPNSSCMDGVGSKNFLISAIGSSDVNRDGSLILFVTTSYKNPPSISPPIPPIVAPIIGANGARGPKNGAAKNPNPVPAAPKKPANAALPAALPIDSPRRRFIPKSKRGPISAIRFV